MRRHDAYALAEALGYDLKRDRIFSITLGVDDIKVDIEVNRADLNENGQMVHDAARTGVLRRTDTISYED